MLFRSVQGIVQQAIEEFMKQDTARREPAYKTELQEERRRREQLEKRVNELVEENKRSRGVAEEAQRSSTIRTELQRLGVTKVDLAYKAVQDGVVRNEDGRPRSVTAADCRIDHARQYSGDCARNEDD